MSRKGGQCTSKYLPCSNYGDIPGKAVYAGVSALSIRQHRVPPRQGIGSTDPAATKPPPSVPVEQVGAQLQIVIWSFL